MKQYVVDAFARRPFEGNPAAVYVVDFPAYELEQVEVTLQMAAALAAEPVQAWIRALPCQATNRK